MGSLRQVATLLVVQAHRRLGRVFAAALVGVTSELLHKKQDTSRRALVAQVPRPGEVERPRAGAAFAPADDPMNLLAIFHRHWFARPLPATHCLRRGKRLERG